MKIDRELHDLIPPQSPDERKRMIESVILNGWQTHVTIWEGCEANGYEDTLLDGHSRNEAWENVLKAQGIPYPPTKTIALETRKEARDWVMDVTLSRRNISIEVRNELIGRWYLAEKKESAAQPGNKLAEKTVRQNDAPNKQAGKRTSEVIAEKAGVSSRTVERAAKKVQEADEAKAKPKAEPKPDSPKDPAGLEIQPGHEDVFCVSPIFRKAMALVTQAENTIAEQCGEHEGARVIDLHDVKTLADDFRNMIKEATPHTRCPDCKPGKGNKQCTRCKGRSWICFSEFRTLGGPQKEALGLK